MERDHWFVAATHPWAERLAYEKLIESGFVAYSPTHQLCRIVRGARRCRDAPLFPGYVFVEASREWRRIVTLRGVLGLLPIGREEPLGIAAEVVVELRTRIESGEFETPAGDAWLAGLVRGEELRVTSGGMVDRVGKFLGRDRGRIVLLLQLFNRETAVPIPAHNVELAK